MNSVSNNYVLVQRIVEKMDLGMNAIESVLLTVKRRQSLKIDSDIKAIAYVAGIRCDSAEMKDHIPEFTKVVTAIQKEDYFEVLPHGVRAAVDIALATIKNKGEPLSSIEKRWIRFKHACLSLGRALSRIYSSDPKRSPEYLTELLKVETEILDAFDKENNCEISQLEDILKKHPESCGIEALIHDFTAKRVKELKDVLTKRIADADAEAQAQPLTPTSEPTPTVTLESKSDLVEVSTSEVVNVDTFAELNSKIVKSFVKLKLIDEVKLEKMPKDELITDKVSPQDFVKIFDAIEARNKAFDKFRKDLEDI